MLWGPWTIGLAVGAHVHPTGLILPLARLRQHAIVPAGVERVVLAPGQDLALVEAVVLGPHVVDAVEEDAEAEPGLGAVEGDAGGVAGDALAAGAVGGVGREGVAGGPGEALASKAVVGEVVTVFDALRGKLERVNP